MVAHANGKIETSILFDLFSALRIGAEACRLNEKLDKMKASQGPSSEGCEKSQEETNFVTIEVSLIFSL
jgi:hypothetical protein